MSLRSKAFRAVFWVAFARQTGKVVSFLIHLLLARLLAPEAFGIVAICSIVVSSARVFQDLGLGQTLIARGDNSDEAANTAFYMSAGMGVVLCGALLALAPVAAAFFKNAAVGPLLRLMSVILIFNSLSTVPSALLQKDLCFKSLAWPQVSGTVAFGLVAIPLALAGFGAWSMVWGNLATSILDAALKWKLTSWRPRFGFDARVARELFSYSKHIVAVSIGTFLQANVDSMMVGRVLGASQLGYYDLAFSLGRAVPLALLTTLAPVSLPTYSQLRDQPERLANVYLRSIKYVLLVIVPLSAMLALLAREVVLIFYGKVWEPTIVPLQIFCLYAVIGQAASANGPLLLATHKTREWSRIVYFNLAFFVALAIPAMEALGLVGVSLLMVCQTSIGCLLVFWVNGRTLHIAARRFLALTVWPFSATGVAVFALVALRHLLPGQYFDLSLHGFVLNALILAAQATVFLVLYAAMVYATDADVRTQVKMVITFALGKGALQKLFVE